MNKKIIAIVIMGVVLTAGGFVLYLQRSEILDATQKITKNVGGQKSDAMSIEDKKITTDKAPFKIDITYPYISGLDDFNKKVTNIVTKNLNDFETNSLANDAAVKQVDPKDYAKYPREYDLNIGYTKGEIDKNIVSVVFEIYSFVGGAHGVTNFIPLNYNVKSKTEIQLSDLFSETPDCLQKISNFCKKDLTQQITKNSGSTEGSWINDGAGPTAENYSVFLINEDNLVFYFQQYQVAPGAYGNFEVTMPR
jgi:hypothetical protein